MSLLRKKIKGLPQAQVDKVMSSERVHKAVDAKAKVVQDYWKSVSPVFGDRPPHRAAPAHGQPGDYRDSIVVVDKSDENGFRDRVKPTDFKAKWIEFGTKHQKPVAPMAKVKAKFRRGS